MMRDRIRNTDGNRLTGSIRLMLAAVFLMAGPAKILVPNLAEAWSGQLLASKLPLFEFSRVIVPYVEALLGIVLAVGFFTRPTALGVTGIMAVATYVHVVVDDPSLFPLQPSEPIIPIAVIVLSLYLLWRGAGAWSLDLTKIKS